MSSKQKKDRAISATLTLVGTVCVTVAIRRWVRVRRQKRKEELEKTRLEAFAKLENRRSLSVPYLLAKIALPSLKSILIPVKSVAVACLPFMEEVQLIESIKNGCTYRVELTGNKLSGIEVRRVDSHDFEPVADLLTRHFLQQDNTQSVSVNSLVSSNNTVCDNPVVQSSTDSALNTSLSVLEALSQTPSTGDLVPTAEATDSLINVPSAANGSQSDKPPGTLLTDVKIDEVYLWEVEHLSKRFATEAPDLVNFMKGTTKKTSDNPPSFLRALSGLNNGDEEYEGDDNDNNKPTAVETHYTTLIGVNECILADIVRRPGGKSHSKAFIRAGPRRKLHFNPVKVNAAIVTCGGLCPGLNNVVREITNSLISLYGIKGKVWGIRGGYKGFYDPETPPIDLNPKVVENIHHEGGTVLGSSRGGFDLDKIISFIEKKKIKQLYVIGGDGTHRGAFIIHEGCMKKGLNVAVAGIPKTIDNDVDHIDRSFGFQTSVEAAQDAIRCAKTEATCNLPNGVGIVKLMGRSAGFIAAFATLGSGDVDLCLIPEVPIILDGELGCLPHLYKRVKQKGYAVVVVAEGAGEDVLGTSLETDASGNKKLPAIGSFMKKQTEDYFKSKGETATVKYIDPSYMIRSCAANAADSLYCMQLAQNAVHGAMAGFTGFSVGLCKNKMVLLPIPELVATSPRMLNNRGRTYERLLALTRQPNTVPSLVMEETN